MTRKVSKGHKTLNNKNNKANISEFDLLAISTLSCNFNIILKHLFIYKIYCKICNKNLKNRLTKLIKIYVQNGEFSIENVKEGK